jgi:hypothetical protein
LRLPPSFAFGINSIQVGQTQQNFDIPAPASGFCIAIAGIFGRKMMKGCD